MKQLAWTCLKDDCRHGSAESDYDNAASEQVKKAYKRHITRFGHPVVLYDENNKFDGDLKQEMHVHSDMGTDKGFESEA